MINALFMWVCLPVSWIYGEGQVALDVLISGGISFVLGVAIYAFTRHGNPQLRKREGYLIVTSGWLMLALTGTLPYIFSDSISNFGDAFFETMSGYSTTGATVLADIEALPKTILFWRSFTQWIGGMGVVVLTVAIFPILGIGGMQLFIAEAPGLSPDKIQPRIKETAKRLWFIYLGLTVAEMGCLYASGMSAFDAINHGLTTMATGGFSTKNAGIASFSSPLIHYILIFFMFLAGTNFTMLYFIFHGNAKKVLKNEEFIAYTVGAVTVSIIVALGVWWHTGYDVEYAFRMAMFHVISVVTTTGFVLEDYLGWGPFVLLIFVFLLFVGGSAGSTAGGVKVVRHIVLIKNSFLELRRQLHTSAIMLVRLHGKSVSEQITFNILAFVIIYILIFGAGALLLSLFGMDFVSALGASATCLGNVGPGLGVVGPAHTFAEVPLPSKWLLSFLMLLGRLELFTVLILFTSTFWRKGG